MNYKLKFLNLIFILILILVSTNLFGDTPWLNPTGSVSLEVGTDDLSIPVTFGVAISNDNNLVTSSTFYLYQDTTKFYPGIIVTGEGWANPMVGWKLGLALSKRLRISETGGSYDGQIYSGMPYIGAAYNNREELLVLFGFKFLIRYK